MAKTLLMLFNLQLLKKLFVAPATIQLAGAEVELVGIVSRETIVIVNENRLFS